MNAPAPSPVRTAVAAPSDSAQRVLEAALRLFSRHGFDGTSLQAIADELGVTKAAVYYHFHTKDELLEALIEPAFRELEQLHADASAGRGRASGMTAYIDYLLRHRRLAVWMGNDVGALTRPAVLERARSVQDQLDAMLLGTSRDRLTVLWSSSITRALGAAVVSQPHVSDEWLRGQLNDMGKVLVAGYRAARRREGSAAQSGDE